MKKVIGEDIKQLPGAINWTDLNYMASYPEHSVHVLEGNIINYHVWNVCNCSVDHQHTRSRG